MNVKRERALIVSKLKKLKKPLKSLLKPIFHLQNFVHLFPCPWNPTQQMRVIRLWWSVQKHSFNVGTKDSLSKSLWIALARGRRVVSSELTGAA